MGVAIKDHEKTALLEKTCSKAHAAVRLQSPCSCRCFGSRTSMFSIHCKVLSVGRKKKKKAYWFKREGKEKLRAEGTHHRNPLESLVSSPLMFSIS